jgi:hypothetical protein
MALKQAIEMLTGASGTAVVPTALQAVIGSSTALAAVNSSINDLSTYIAGSVANARTGADGVRNNTTSTLSSQISNNTSSITQEAITRAAADGALSATLTSVAAQSSAGTANGSYRLVAVSGTDGAAAEFAVQVAADSGSSYASAGMRIQVFAGPPVTSRVVFDTSQFMVRSGSSTSLPPFTVSGGNIVANSLQVPTANITGTLTANQINVSSLSALNANLGTVTAGLARDANSKFNVDFTNARLTVSD